jgi:hypothetical protein
VPPLEPHDSQSWPVIPRVPYTCTFTLYHHLTYTLIIQSMTSYLECVFYHYFCCIPWQAWYASAIAFLLLVCVCMKRFLITTSTEVLLPTAFPLFFFLNVGFYESARLSWTYVLWYNILVCAYAQKVFLIRLVQTSFFHDCNATRLSILYQAWKDYLATNVTSLLGMYLFECERSITLGMRSMKEVLLLHTKHGTAWNAFFRMFVVDDQVYHICSAQTHSLTLI